MIVRRQITARQIAGSVLLDATEIDGAVWGTFLSGADPEQIAQSFEKTCRSLHQIGGGILAKFAPGAVPADAGEPDILAGRNVLLVLRTVETAASVRDFLAYHVERAGADAALIFDRASQRESVVLEDALGDLGVPILIVQANVPLGRANHPAVSDPSLAPGAPGRMRDDAGPDDLWRAPLGETILLEALRRRWLGAARAVAYLDVGDLLLPGDAGSVFDRAASAADRVVPLVGQEAYPWRLRGDAPAPHSDNICLRLNETRSLSRWCIAPGAPDNGLYWRLIRVGGAECVEGPPARFLRAMGVAFPNVAPAKLVAKSELVESAEALALMQTAFGAEPLRMPPAVVLEPNAKDRRAVTIVTAMKNEGPYILDWLAHNRAIGITRFLVYSNDCSDGTDRLLKLLADHGVIEHRENPYRETGGVPQHAAFRAADTEALVTSSDWLVTLDVDEYINIHRGDGHVNDLFDAVEAANLISMPWRLFGNNDVHAFDPAPVAEQFTRCAHAFSPKPHQAWGFKTLYRNTGLFRRLSVHRPRGMAPQAQEHIAWVNGSGEPLEPEMWQSAWRFQKKNWGYDLVSLHHYAVRSAEGFLVKRDRGRVNHTTRDQGLAYWFRMNHNAVEDTSILRLAPRVAKERAALAGLPGVAEAHEESVAWHRMRARELMESPGHRALYEAITGPRLEKLSRMLANFGTNVFLAGPEVIPDEIVAKDIDETFYFTVERDLVS